MIAALALALAVAAAPADDIAKAKALVDDLSFADAVPVAHAVSEDPSATQAEKLDAMFIEAYCLAVTNRVAEAQALFQKIVAIDVDAHPPIAMEPKVAFLLDKERSDRKAALLAEAQAKQAALFATVKLSVREPKAPSGGERAVFTVVVDDPHKLVKSMRIDFNKEDEPGLYGLPITRLDGDDANLWRGEIPGAYTRSKIGVTLHWFITALDKDGARVAGVGDREHTRDLFISAGLVASDLRVNERVTQGVRLFYAIVTGPLAAAGAVGSLLATEALWRNFDGSVPVEALFLTLVPPAAGAGVAFLATLVTLDGWYAWIPPATAGAIGGLYAVTTLALLAPAISRNDHAADDNAVVQDTLNNYQFSGVVAGAAMLVFTSAAAVTMVAIDAPQE